MHGGIIYRDYLPRSDSDNKKKKKTISFSPLLCERYFIWLCPPPSQKWEAHLVCVWWGGPGQTRDNDTVPKFVLFFCIFSFLLGQIIKKKERKWLLSNHFLNFFFLLNKREKFDNLWRYKMLFHFVFPSSKWHRRLSEQLAARVFSLSFGPHT